jgi:hypothetical protein
MRYAQTLGHTEIFLFTPNRERFYRGIGWEKISDEKYRGELVTVMKIGLIG